MAEIIEEAPVNPDAQSAVTDFLDYTEYLPTDLIRSLTLIRQLDETYLTNSNSIHELTQTYGKLPSLSSSARPDALKLRSTISHHLDLAISARESAYAEASRLFDLTDRHQDRLKSIIAKLNALPKPPSRDPTPQPAAISSNKHQRSTKKPDTAPSTRRLTLKVPKAPVASAIISRPRHRTQRVTVPGEVLPPFDPDEPLASTEVSDWDSDPPTTQKSIVVTGPVRPKPPPKQRSALDTETRSRTPRETATYHKPTPPPEDAPVGSRFHPWTHLSEYEMYRLRKKMKKNHTWEPSEIMVRRELAEKGRGWDNYYKARAAAQANGTPFIDIDDKKPQPPTALKAETSKAEISALLTAQQPTNRPASPASLPVVSTPAVSKSDVPSRPKTLKRSESKKEKEKREGTPRDAASKAAQEAEAAARQLGAITSSLKNLFSPLSVSNALDRIRTIATPSASPAPKVEKKVAKKRKLEETTSASPSIEPEIHQKKKLKLLPKPVPIAPAEPVSTITAPVPVTSGTVSIKIPLKLNLSTPTVSSLPATTPALAPSRPVIAQRVPSIIEKAEKSPPASRPPSRRSAAASVEPNTAASTRPSRRTSLTPAAPTRKTPALDTTPKTMLTAASRRSKREAPGTVTQSSQDGGAAVSISKRKHKPNKGNKSKATADVAKPELRTDVDGNQELLDPDEERYCICGDVSYGEMICCELDEKVGLFELALITIADSLDSVIMDSGSTWTVYT